MSGASPQDVGNAFVQHWYRSREAGAVESLASLFQPNSMMTFEGQQFLGPQAICEKLQTLGAGGGQYSVATTDVQPSVSGSSAILIFVTGSLKLDADKPMQFSEVIQLVEFQPGQYHVHNAIFRLCYSN